MNKKTPVSKFYWYMFRIMASKWDLECMTPIRQVHLRSDYRLYKRGCELSQHSQQEDEQNGSKTERILNKTVCPLTWQTYYRISVVSRTC